jgi:ABC-type phosphate/phosphonate transport system substrate-binding protein
MAAHVTSFRMYNAAPRAAAAWRALFERVFADAAVDVQLIEHRWPRPIDELWSEPALCCAFMCGWPFVRSERGMQAIAAPVPSPPRYDGLPRYCSEFLVREESEWTSIEQTFGHRIGWMSNDSQSGFNAPRAFLARYASPERMAVYREARGPFVTPARTLAALHGGEVDVVALDGYFLDLCRRHDPAMVAGLRCVATTPWTPIPLLVAAPGVEEAIVQRLRAHLLDLHTRPTFAPLLADALLQRFAAPDLASYRELESIARFAIDRGYEVIR